MSAVEAWGMRQHSQEACNCSFKHMQAIDKRQEERHGNHSNKMLPLLQLHVHHHQYQRPKMGREDGQWQPVATHQGTFPAPM